VVKSKTSAANGDSPAANQKSFVLSDTFLTRCQHTLSNRHARFSETGLEGA
jgi:hypothetical protein